ncbi:hypothetical protein [Nocardia aurantia]|uniref:DUF5709 domain-containing protein n=1 Tax=Nocardia aurantia TaxID=2585199 RepID=A0A7K0DXH9_9NOCA|nr:hypothetical protein [Nocardia aurantia]MQY30248.1 hypothetical protein [Nocardia aurantia]
MTDRTLAAGTLGEVPEADLLEQSVPAYPDAPDEEDTPSDTTVAPQYPLPDAHAIREADDADVLEQSVAVPLADDYDTESGGDYDDAPTGYDNPPTGYEDTEY